MPYTHIYGIQMYYETHGGPEAVPIVFLHGLGSSAADWELQAAAFAGRWRVIAPDLREHGRSGRGGPLTVEAMADDVAGLVSECAAAPAHLVGLSLGGCVALALAVRHPDCVRSLTLVNTFARLPPPGWRSAGRVAHRLWLLASAPMPAVGGYVARGLFPKPEQALLYAIAAERLGRNSRRSYLAMLRAVARFDVRGALGGIRCPALIVAGDRDRTVARSAATELQRGIPGAVLRVIADSGHATPYDQTAVFDQVVEEFVEACEERASGVSRVSGA